MAVVDLKGNQLQNAPEWTVNLGFVANFMLGNFLETTINGQYKYVAKKFNTSLFNTPRSEIQPTHLMDLNVDFAPPGVLGLVNLQNPREWGVTFKINW